MRAKQFAGILTAIHFCLWFYDASQYLASAAAATKLILFYGDASRVRTRKECEADALTFRLT